MTITTVTDFSTLRWPARLGLLALSVLLLSLALAPVYQFYFAWIGLVPWMLVVASTRTKKHAFLWSWLGGTMFFFANMWWLFKVTVPGTFVLLAYLGLFWGFAALAFLAFSWRAIHPVVSVPMIAIAFTALEWVRGNWSMFGNQGLPWLYLGNTQSPFLVMCQIADIGGVYAVTFWVVLFNAAVFFAITDRKRIAETFVTVIAVLVAIGAYGKYREMSYPYDSDARNPTVLVIQPNYKQSNSGEKGAPIEEIVKFHVNTTKAALAECEQKNIKVDLIAWSETMMPPLNPSMRRIARGTKFGEFLQETYDQLASLANESNAAMIVGGAFSDDWKIHGDDLIASDRRNSAYYFERTGLLSEKRYDKIHLVPFGEFIPYDSIAFIHAILMKLGPSGYENYVLTPGDENAITVFEISNDNGGTDRFVVPICFEDIVGPLCAKMVRGPGGTKRADFLVNITNDGWFMGGQMDQHLQAAVFRAIENRTPMARCVNTGVSGFIDSLGRVYNTVPANTERWSVGTLPLDPRVTFYTKHGDLFVQICAAITAVVVVGRVVTNVTHRKGKTTS